MSALQELHTGHNNKQNFYCLVEIVIIWLNTNFQKQQLGSLNINGDRYRQIYQLFNLQMIWKTKSESKQQTLLGPTVKRNQITTDKIIKEIWK